MFLRVLMCQERQKPRAVSVGITLRVAEEKNQIPAIANKSLSVVSCSTSH